MIRGEEMHKSARNAVEIDEVLKHYSAPVVRMFFCSAQYRSQIDYNPGSLDEARAVWERFRAFLRAGPRDDAADAQIADQLAAFGEAMDDDLNTPGALAALHDLVSRGNRGEPTRAAVEAGLRVLGFDVGGVDAGADVVGPLVDLLLEQREAARAAKDFARADEIRNRLEGIGVRVEDSAAGPRWFIE
jgi:cysteinyl-tRNA synthetase